MGETMKLKLQTILAALIAMILLASTASAYVPEKYRTSGQMSDYEIVKTALVAHDSGDNSRWVLDTLEDAVIHHTNSGRSLNNYFQLRLWLTKIEQQKEKKLEPIRGIIENLVGPELPGWCSGYDEKCQKKVN